MLCVCVPVCVQCLHDGPVPSSHEDLGGGGGLCSRRCSTTVRGNETRGGGAGTREGRG